MSTNYFSETRTFFSGRYNDAKGRAGALERSRQLDAVTRSLQETLEKHFGD